MAFVCSARYRLLTSLPGVIIFAGGLNADATDVIRYRGRAASRIENSISVVKIRYRIDPQRALHMRPRKLVPRCSATQRIDQ